MTLERPPRLTMGAMEGLKVSELAGCAGTSPDTVRYYEWAGLLAAPRRTAVGYRVYGAEAVERLRFIRGAQRFGLRLREVRELLEILDRGQCPCGYTETLVRRRITGLDEEMARLAETRRQLLELAPRHPAGSCPEEADPWPCEVEFVGAGR